MTITVTQLGNFLKALVDSEVLLLDLNVEGEISGYAREAVMLLAGAGALNGMGDGTFAPKDPCTRAQCAVVLHKLING